MQIAVLKERVSGERRVAISQEMVAKFCQNQFSVVVETGAGDKAHITDEMMRAAGATIAPSAEKAVKDANIILKVRAPMVASEGRDEISLFKKGQYVISMLEPFQNPIRMKALAKTGALGFAMELMPRITRAQSMDVLSSQSNIAGYKAVLDACAEYSRVLPMMMTAAGTVTPARIFIMGVGVAGLQAIATAKRLGAIVSATDVRPATKEQVESLGGSFVAVEDDEFLEAQTAGGYAKQMSEDYQKKQAAFVHEHIQKQDIVITTALIPGRAAPVLVTEDMVKVMKEGSIIVDLAVEAGGNCPLSQLGKVVDYNGVKIIGWGNWPSRVPEATSKLYARNLYSFIELLWDKEKKALNLNLEDEVIQSTLICNDFKVVHANLVEKNAIEDKPADESKKTVAKKVTTKKAAVKKVAAKKA